MGYWALSHLDRLHIDLLRESLHWKLPREAFVLCGVLTRLCVLQGDVKKLTDDIAALKPTIFVAVPRVLERIQSGIQAKLSAKPWIMRALVGLAMKWKLMRIKAGAPLHKVHRNFCHHSHLSGLLILLHFLSHSFFAGSCVLF